MTTGLTRSSQKSRIVGLVLIGIGAVFLYFFVKQPIGELPGLSHAWRGGPLLLGAGFFSINGCFLLFQKRFSLGAFLISGFLSAALTSGTYAYVRNIREVWKRSETYYCRPENLDKFIARSQALVTTERIRQFTDDVEAMGWFQNGFKFDTASITYGGGTDPNSVVVTLTCEFSPFVHPNVGRSKEAVIEYSDALHTWIAQSLDSPIPPKTAAVDVMNPFVSRIGGPSGVARLISTVGSWLYIKRNVPHDFRELERVVVIWLRDRETDPELKSYLSSVADEVDKSKSEK